MVKFSFLYIYLTNFKLLMHRRESFTLFAVVKQINISVDDKAAPFPEFLLKPIRLYLA